MAGLENFSLYSSLVSVALAIMFVTFDFMGARRAVSASTEKTAKASTRNITGVLTTLFSTLVFVFLTIVIVARWTETGHGPFSNMYEFAVAFAWGTVVMGFFFQRRYRTGAFRNIGLFIALLLLIFASVKHTQPEPLVPALQQSVLLSVHVASAVVAYGTLTIGFGAAVLFLIQHKRNSVLLPAIEVLETVSYQSVAIGFPFLTALIILGALWADIAWGRYWSWDPKETASLVTWLLYAAYLHARLVRGWRGTRTAVLLIIGFAAILLTFFGNYIFTGLHAYG
jgi:cytochrome c-type biogenesis protein CcsB